MSINLMEVYITEALKEKGVTVETAEEPLEEQQDKEIENDLLHLSVRAEIESKICVMIPINWIIDKSSIVVRG